MKPGCGQRAAFDRTTIFCSELFALTHITSHHFTSPPPTINNGVKVDLMQENMASRLSPPNYRLGH